MKVIAFGGETPVSRKTSMENQVTHQMSRFICSFCFTGISCNENRCRTQTEIFNVTHGTMNMKLRNKRRRETNILYISCRLYEAWTVVREEEDRFEGSEMRYLQLQTGAELSDGMKNKSRRKAFI